MLVTSCLELIWYYAVQLPHFYLEAHWVCSHHSANLCFCASFTVHFSPLITSFQKWEKRGERRKKKTKKESISGKCVHLSIKSEQKAFRTRGRLESEDTSYESQVKFHTEQTDKGCIFPIVVKKFRLSWKGQSHSSTESLKRGHCDKVNTHPSYILVS